MTENDWFATVRGKKAAEDGGETAMADAEQQLEGEPAEIDTHALAVEAYDHTRAGRQRRVLLSFQEFAMKTATDLAQRLGRQAEAACRYYLSAGHREGRYWLVGDARNTPGRSMFVRLTGPVSGKGAAGKWTEYVAPRVMLRPRDGALSYRRSTASAQHNVSAPREVS
ncbi:hypothetical protein IQ26_03406 [Mesorhizobium tianshanense]|uniref:Uncharacterized protein n=2 Tax=Mesorhizobium tianshanense TaxID=39844 RepID=A0A562NRD4_9HYPH|nr:hypothetical protein IQ26_03406 [Mesorhizobium tianshanense]